MKKVLHIIGLGPAGLEYMTLRDYRLIKEAKGVFFRTFKHPCAQELLAEGITAQSFDYLYEKEESFEKVYEGILSSLTDKLEKYQEVVYAVPGHPTVAERSVQLLVDKLSGDVEVKVYGSVSFLDPLFAAISLDPANGFLLLNYDQLKGREITGKEWLVIPQVYDPFIASDVKLDLMEVYPDETEVFLVKSLGAQNEEIKSIKLYELDHQEFDHLSTVVVPPNPRAISTTRLLEVMQKLRSPEGCPWDREQNHDSLVPYLVEESYEVIDAIESQDMYNLAEELGDLLLQIVFHAQVAQETGEFGYQDVLQGIIEKMVRRHPHVFGDLAVKDSAEVLQNWDQIKNEEKERAEKKEFFDFPQGLPALMLAEKTQKRVAKIGFDWPDSEGPLTKVYEELEELKEAMQRGLGIEEEFGDILFACVNLSRFLKVHSEDALRKTIKKFQRRFLEMESLARIDGHKLEGLTLEEMDFYWEKAKIKEKTM
ncbi:MAG: nucleoside triphosphate pyrophosphohydrolase [Desulfitobacterium sp.]|nr:nucleoside triphosphate pyrophosphohydrolase [Desulfitobacterium sp.]